MNEEKSTNHPNNNLSQHELEDEFGMTKPVASNRDSNQKNEFDEKTIPTQINQEEDKKAEDISDFSDTVSTPIINDKESEGPKQVKPSETPMRKKKTWLIIGIIGIIILILIAIISAVAGYGSGISLRKNAEHTQVSIVVEEQFQLGLQEMEQGQYLRARQRFEYIIELNPNYPGITEKLAEVLLELNTTATPTLVPTPTLTPTPDLRGVQGLYDQSKQYLTNGEWASAIDSLLILRKTDSEFQKVDVDGMLFIALRNRGQQKIVNQADLEGGIYDLTLAGKFGPLDTEAEGLLNWSTMYITGASFWEIDWEQVLYYFEQVAAQLPHLTDGSGWTAIERYRVALFEYGNMLARQGKYCKAVQYYQQSLSYSPDPQVQEALNVAAKGCNQNSGEQQTPEAED